MNSRAMFKVVITDSLAPPVQIEESALDGVASVHCLRARGAEELKGRLRDADGILLYHEVWIPPEILDEMTRCRVIVRCGVGYDNVDVKAAGARGIVVCNVPDYGVDEVADHAIGMMLALNRGFMKAERALRTALRPWDCEAVKPVMRLAGATMGIVGCGRIGSATALRAKALKMNVLVYDPYLRPGTDKVLGVEQTDLKFLLRHSDVVSLHCPLTAETRRIIDGNALGEMKETAFLVNTARGEVVDTDILADVLREHGIAGAGIDVLASEPPTVSQKLIQLWQEEIQPPVNLMITPHVAYYSESGFVEMRRKGAEELARVLRGEAPLNCVNAKWLTPGGRP